MLGLRLVEQRGGLALHAREIALGKAHVLHHALLQGPGTAERLGEGPCITALLEADVIRIEDITTDPRWPRFAEGAGVLPAV